MDYSDLDLSKNYGIMLSGGLDSSVLLYLLIRKNPNIKIQPFTIPKKDGAMLYVNSIIDHFNQKFDLNIPHTITVGDPDAYHRYQSSTAIKEIFEKYQIDFIFNALNKVPKELADVPGVPIRTSKSDHSKIILPFVDLYKTDILKIMFNERQEDLMTLTHSCTEQTDRRCGSCWQCQERSWAFKQLNRQDIGIT